MKLADIQAYRKRKQAEANWVEVQEAMDALSFAIPTKGRLFLRPVQGLALLRPFIKTLVVHKTKTNERHLTHFDELLYAGKIFPYVIGHALPDTIRVSFPFPLLYEFTLTFRSDINKDPALKDALRTFLVEARRRASFITENFKKQLTD